MSLYTLDGNTRQLLRLVNFGAPDFSVRSFVEQLSGSQRHLDEDQRLDPKPYIRTFESAANELERLYEIALSQEEAAASAATQLTDSRHQESQKLANQVKECVKEVKALDEIATETQQFSGPLGMELEKLSVQHQQVSNYRMLTSAYFTFLAGRQPLELTRMWSQDPRKCAKFTAELQALASAIGPLPNQLDVQAQIDKFAENLENQLLDQFQNRYENFDLPGMRETAEILTDFNGGGAVTQAYINQHRFFMNVDQLLPSEDPSSSTSKLWPQLCDFRAPYPEFAELCDRVISEIGETIYRETKILPKVFPRPVEVLSLFMQRTFAQKIQELINTYMDTAAQQDQTIAQVRVLGACYSRINLMVVDLQKKWASDNIGLSEPEQHELSAALEGNRLDAFVLYLDDYFALETQSLREIMDQELDVNRVKYRTTSLGDQSTQTALEDGKMDRLRRAMRNLTHDDSENELVPSEAPTTTPGTPVEPLSASSGDGFSSIEDPNLLRLGNHHRWSRLQHLSVTSVHNILAAFGEAISREQILRRPTSFGADATFLYNLLTRELGGRYISSVIDSALAHSLKLETKSVVNWSFVESIKTSGHALRLLSAFVKTVLFAMVQEYPQTQQSMADALNTYILNVQRSCLQLMEQCVDILHQRTLYLFSRNSKRDFIDPPGGTAGSVLSTEVFEEFKSFSESVKEHLSLENSQRVLKLAAHNLYLDLMQHIRQHTISIEGGIALTNDINRLDELITDEFSNTREIQDHLATLKAVTKLFSSEQSLLSSLLRDSHLSRLPPNELRSLVGLRSDYSNKLSGIRIVGPSESSAEEP